MKALMMQLNGIMLMMAALLLGIAANAQGIHGKPAIRKPVIEKKIIAPKTPAKPNVNIKQNTSGSAADKRRPVINMKEFKNTPAFSVRQASYSTNFKDPSKAFTMDDGSTLKINFKKSADGGQADDISSRQVTPAKETKDGDWKCVASTLQVNARSTNFGVSDYQKQAANIYPGAIYTFDNLMNGSFRTQTGARNPIIISTDNKNMSGDTYVEVASPSRATIQNGIAALYRRFSGAAANGSTVMQLYESYNTADWTLKLNAGGSAWGVSINNSFKSSDKSQHRYLTIDVKKTLFTINTLPPEKGFFTNPADEASAPNMMFISSVAYGIRILANLEITFKSSEAANEFNAKYKSGFYNASVDLNYLQNNSSVETRINAYIVGGPNEGIITFDRDKLISTLNKILSGATYQNAQAISYSLCDMAGNVIGSQSATDQFAYRNCVPAKNPPLLKSVFVTVQCGADGKDRDTHYRYALFSSRSKDAKVGVITMKGIKTSMASYANDSDNSRFENNSSNNTNELKLNQSTGDHPLDEFYEQGYLRILIEPNGHDEWQIATLKLTLNFNDGSSKFVQWNNIVMSHENKTKDLYFKGGPDGALTAIN
jgi:hypothetical protein